MQDLNTRLSNFAKTCEGRAATLRAEAANIRSQPKATNWEAYNAQLEKKATDLETQASLWDRRRQTALQGFLLGDDFGMDLGITGEFGELYTQAAAQSRLKFTAPQAEPGNEMLGAVQRDGSNPFDRSIQTAAQTASQFSGGGSGQIVSGGKDAAPPSMSSGMNTPPPDPIVRSR